MLLLHITQYYYSNIINNTSSNINNNSDKKRKLRKQIKQVRQVGLIIDSLVTKQCKHLWNHLCVNTVNKLDGLNILHLRVSHI